MTSRLSRRSNGKQESRSYQLDAEDRSHPAKTRIATAWETISTALDDIPPTEAVVILMELERRCRETSLGRFRHLMQLAKKDAPNANPKNRTEKH